MRRLPGLLAALVLLSGSAHATDVVKIMNFSCPVCRAAENLDYSIREAVVATGGRFVPAPVPADDTPTARERVYYAARLQGDEAEQAVRKSLYKGAQDMQMPLEDVAQTVAWLQDDLAGSGLTLDWTRLVQDAEGERAETALGRAARLAVNGGVQRLPFYIVLKNNQIIGAFDPQSTGSNSLIGLRDAVVKAVSQPTSSK